MDTALYYICSTIPQVLAGAIALLAVFWVYKIGVLNNKLKGYGRSVIRETSKFAMSEEYRKENFYPSTIKRSIESSIEKDDFTAIKRSIDIAYSCGHFGKDNGSLKDFMEFFEREERQKKSLTRSTRNAIIFSSVVIFLTLLPIPFAEFITYSGQCCGWSCVTVFILVILLFGFNIGLISKTVYKALTE